LFPRWRNGAADVPARLLLPAGTTDVVIVDTLTTSVDFSGNAIVNMISQTAVREPSSQILFGSALAGLGWLRRRETA
jgi:hypothetical protein